MALLDINDLRVEFPSRRGHVVAIENLTLQVAPGEILGVVGESGAGKSTIGNAVIGLLEPPGEMTAGQIRLNTDSLDSMSESDLRSVRGRRIGMIFQDPLTSLDPLQTVEHQLVTTIEEHLSLGEAAAIERAVDLLDQVGIPDPALRIKQYPHQFSGGMRQRVVIALALCADPELIIADEPTTALDVSVQAQILELMKSLCRERNVGMILITHDMGVIAETADRVAVMYRGRVHWSRTSKTLTTHSKVWILIRTGWVRRATLVMRPMCYCVSKNCICGLSPVMRFSNATDCTWTR